MRVARFVWVLLVLAVAVPAGIAPPQAFASPQPDSIPLPRPRVATLFLESGDSIAVAFVGPHSQGFIRYETEIGWLDYVSVHKVARIRSDAGGDITSRVLDDRRAIGVSSAGARHRPSRPGASRGWLAPPFSYPPTRNARVYAITEATLYARSGRDAIVGNGTLLLVGAGTSLNVTPEWGVGAVVHYGIGDRDYRTADVGIRIRYAPTNRLGIETAHGLFAGSTDSWETRGRAYFGEGAVTLSDALSVVVRAESAEWEQSYVVLSAPGFIGPVIVRRRSETYWRVGARVGPYPRWITVPAVIVGAVLFLAPRERVVY